MRFIFSPFHPPEMPWSSIYSILLTHSRLLVQDPPTGFLSVESPTLAPREFEDDEKEDFGLVEESLAGLLPPVQDP